MNIILYFCIGYFGWLIFCYFSKDGILLSDLLDAIGWGLVGPLIIFVLLIYMTARSNKFIIKKYKKENNYDSCNIN